MTHPTIYSYVREQESLFETEEIRVGSNWSWNFRNHVQMIFHLKNGVFFTGENNWLRSFKNIMEPILNLNYWTEDIEVKHVVFFIESSMGRVLSFFIKKYHDEVYTREHNLDELFDEITESDIDFGGVLVKKGEDRPEVLHLTTIAFGDQEDLMSAPMGFKKSFSPDKLRGMEKQGWGKESNGATTSIQDLIVLAEYDKDPKGFLNASKNRSSGKTIDTYIVLGSLPEAYLKDNDNMENVYFQTHVIAYYTDKNHKEHGVTLFRKKGGEDLLKFFTSKKVPGRALGRGQGEALLHPQVWTNFLSIHKMSLLEASSKVVLQTDDPNFQNRNKIQDMEQLEITTVADGKQIGQVPTVGVANIQLHEGAINEWFDYAQLSGAAFDPLLGAEAKAGTTFRGQERTVAQGRGLHDRRRGQRSKFIEEIYRDWIIPDIIKEITGGKEFLASLAPDELRWVSEQLAENHASNEIAEDILNRKTPKSKEELKREFLADFLKQGSQFILKILKDEYKNKKIRIGINVAGKQKNLADLSDRILYIFQFIFANPQGFKQAMQVSSLAKSFNDILEFSGLNQVDFADLLQKIPDVPPQEMLTAPQTGAPQMQRQQNMGQVVA